ncbi:hypothetical protein [Leifsonia sp. C5G2]|uniref:hypothetical protein n=1 Tax=Leifsonia sp. C5G2 TaxID=2735269 RepID=UPI001585162A|nr:hypothetical protein [Leifsonia sp. C5G2]NUU08408.1 hypothetical protein [Leifsonia sp. C5G2]
MAQRKAHQRGNPAARGPASNKPGKRRPQGYRLSERTIQRWTRGLIYAMLIGFAIGGVIALVGVIINNNDLPPLGLGLAVLWALVILLIAAFMGGQALGRFGGILGLALIAGIVFGLTGDLIAPWVHWAGLAVAVLAGIGFFIMGIWRRVPIWFGGSNDGPPR